MSIAELPKFGMGAAPRRIEDQSLITGAGHYVDDYAPSGTLRAYILRSNAAHARIKVDGLHAARKMPGVHLIWAADDLPPLGFMPAARDKQFDGSYPHVPPRALLAQGLVRHVGEPIAIIVADDLESAKAAGDAVEVEYDALEVVTEADLAIEPGAPLVWAEHGSNVAYESHVGDQAATDAAFAKAARVSKVRVVNNRLVPNYMETRGIVAEFDATNDRYTLTIGTQGSHGMRAVIAKDILKIPTEAMRVITPDVGGAFGPKGFVYHEYPLAALAAKKLGRPVKWIGDRAEHFLSDAQGRDNITTAEMAMDANGRFLAMRVDLLCNLGAYMGQYGAYLAPGGARMSTGVYDVPELFARVRGIYTNTVVTDAYRGAGRPEAAYLIDRLVEQCGRDSGLGPVEIRKRNFIRPEKMPYRTPAGRTYDSGEFAAHLDQALKAADHQGFAARRAEAKARGKVRGLGFASYIEACAFAGEEPATVRLNADGGATLFIGTQAGGQGHATAYAQFIVGHLGIDYDRVNMVQGDTDQVAQGGGTGGSRSIPLGAVSVDRAAAILAEKIKTIAAEALEASAADLELGGGMVRVAGTDRSMTLAEVAAAAKDSGQLSAVETYHQPVPTYPNGTHVCELEIDPDTGVTEIVAYTIVDDFGATVNPLLLAGQVHGGVAQGIGQALLERTVYNEDGQILSGTFMDYCMPRATDMPFFSFQTRNVPCTTNAFGIKGAGEAGSVGACAAVMNAVIDALAESHGIEHVDMPATPALLWAAMHKAA